MARVFAGLLVLCGLVAAVLVSAPAAPATDRASDAHAGHRHALSLPVHRLEGAARKRWPRSFAGLWQERGKVFIAFTKRAKRRTSRLRALAAKPGKLRARSFEFSLRQLETTQERMIDDREERPPGTVDLPDYDLDIDITKNAPVVTLESVIPDWEERFAQLYGEHVIVREGALAEFDACLSRSSCTPYLRAGLRVLIKLPGGLVPCSTSFSVIQRSVAYRGILSAAHCGTPDFDEGVLRYHGTGSAPPSYGFVKRDRMLGRTDAELHQITSSSFSRRPWIFDSNSLKERPVQRVSDWNWVRPGMGMCKVGQTTGKTCGKVKSRYFSPSIIPSSERFIKTGYCAEGGDSGGGVYYPNKLGTGETKVTAYGIHSGGAKGFECTPGQPLLPGDYSYFGHIQYAQTALGVRVQVTN
jgi:hypothetical protein